MTPRPPAAPADGATVARSAPPALPRQVLPIPHSSDNPGGITAKIRRFSMQRVWAQPLRQQLFLALVFLLAPMLLAAAGLGYVEYRETVEELSEQTQATAMRSAAAIERELMGLDRMARNLSN